VRTVAKSKTDFYLSQRLPSIALIFSEIGGERQILNQARTPKKPVLDCIYKHAIAPEAHKGPY